ncbi:MAG: hypothetical protein Q9199_007651 [Rusavskia elegans]
MELSSPFLPEDLPWLEIAIAIVGVILTYVVVRSTILREDVEAPADYTVPLPEQCKPGWSGTISENPSIKIPRSSAIQCYNPATGQLLGQVNPATPDGIDRAVARAADAQIVWATTTFKQRRKVLRTMLKYVLMSIAALSLREGQVDIGGLLVGSFWTIKKTSQR